MLKKLLLTACAVFLCNTALAGVITNSPMDTAAFWTNRIQNGDNVIKPIKTISLPIPMLSRFPHRFRFVTELSPNIAT